MTVSIEGFLKTAREPVVVRRDDPLALALRRMEEYDFSQLPVVDGENEPVGMISHGSVASGVWLLGAKTTDLRVRDVMKTDVAKHSIEDDPLRAIDALKNAHAMIIVDEKGKLYRVLTLFDVAEFLRAGAQEVFFLEEIETTIRDWVRALVGPDVDVDLNSPYGQALRRVSSSRQEEYKRFKKAIVAYGTPDQAAQGAGVAVDEGRARSAFDAHLSEKFEVRPLERLTFQELTSILFEDTQWTRIQQAVAWPKDLARSFLDDVREARNTAAHFRTLSTEERARVRKAWEWVRDRNELVLDASKQAALPPSSASSVPSSPAPTSPRSPVPDLPPGLASTAPSQTVGEAVAEDESRYAKLAAHLAAIPETTATIELEFTAIEDLIGGALPDSAREQRSWWANDGRSHVQSRQWLAVGWRVAAVRFTERRVVFVRNQEREQAYLRFYGSLLADLKKHDLVRASLVPTHRNFLVLRIIPLEHPVGQLTVSFNRRGDFGIWLYCERPSSAANKAAYHKLEQQRARVETLLGSPCRWEPLPGQSEARVGVIFDAFITDPERELQQLRNWVVETLPRFERVVTDVLEDKIEAT